MNGCSKKLCPMQVGAVDNCSLTKEQCPYFTQDVDHQKVLDQITALVAYKILSDLKKQIHDRAVYPQNSCIDSYISLKVVDEIIEKEISHVKGGG